MSPGAAELRASLYGGYAAAPITVVAGRAPQVLPPLALSAGGGVRGAVRTPDGTPMRGVRVAIVANGNRVPAGHRLQRPWTLTDRRGRYAFPRLQPGRYGLVAGDRGQFDVEVVAGTTITCDLECQ